MPDTQPFLVYRDRIGVPSEISFLRRQYVGFTRLHPIWTGRTLLPDAAQVGDHRLRLGGPISRLLFRHLGMAPDLPTGLAPVVHAQFARGGALALPLARAINAALVVTLHGGDVSKDKNWRGTVLARRWPTLLRRTAQFVCVSQAVAAVAAARGVPDTKLTVLPIGVEIPAPHPPAMPVDHLFVGRFVEKKGIPVMADAIRQLRRMGDLTPVTFIGDGPLRPTLEALAHEQPGIMLTGWLPPDAVQARMARAISLVVPSIVATTGDAEGLPSVIPEAMAQRCPVIGSDQGGIAEAIQDDQTGLLVPPGNPASLATAMHRLVSQPTVRTRLADAGYHAATANLNARLQSAKLESLLLSMRP